MTAITITLPGPAITFTIEPDALARWLRAAGWRCMNANDSTVRWVYWESKDGHASVCLPRDWSARHAGDVTSEAIQDIAHADGIDALSFVAALCATGHAPAEQWAHLSTAQRAPVLSLLSREASDARAICARLRAAGEGDTEAVLTGEGRAMALEAAAVVLRGTGQP